MNLGRVLVASLSGPSCVTYIDCYLCSTVVVVVSVGCNTGILSSIALARRGHTVNVFESLMYVPKTPTTPRKDNQPL